MGACCAVAGGHILNSSLFKWMTGHLKVPNAYINNSSWHFYLKGTLKRCERAIPIITKSLPPEPGLPFSLPFSPSCETFRVVFWSPVLSSWLCSWAPRLHAKSLDHRMWGSPSSVNVPNTGVWGNVRLTRIMLWAWRSVCQEDGVGYSYRVLSMQVTIHIKKKKKEQPLILRCR